MIDRANGSSGLVRDDFYDWPARIGELIEAEKPAAVVGDARRQRPSADAGRGRRARRCGRRTGSGRVRRARRPWPTPWRDNKVPLVWVGVPAFKSTKMLIDMLAFNEIYPGGCLG